MSLDNHWRFLSLVALIKILILFSDMAREAGTAALKDAGIQYQDVEAVVASYCYGEPTSGKIIMITKNHQPFKP